MQNRFNVYRKSNATGSTLEYVAWQDGSDFAFTINDGRVPGQVSRLPADEFWKEFSKLRQDDEKH
jgi:hypothetical protein